MIKKFIEKWDKNRNKLEEYFRKTKQQDYGDYEGIVKKVVEIILNFNEDENSFNDTFSVEDLVVIDNGDFQGMQLFITHIETYQPDFDDYIVFNNYYGSCSGCDTLLSISEYDEELPTEQQIKGYMQLALHLIQTAKWLDCDKNIKEEKE